MIALVSIDRNSSKLNSSYEYNIPSSLLDKCCVGASVIVPFGFDNVEGYIIDVYENSLNDIQKKDIIDCVNTSDEFGHDSFELAKVLSEKLNCSFGNVYSLMIPSFLKGVKKKYLYVLDYDKLDANLATFLNGKTKVELTDDLNRFKQVINSEVEKGNIKVGYDFSYYGKNKLVKVYSIDNGGLQSTSIRNSIITYLKLHPKSTMDDICINTNSSKNIVNALVQNKAIKQEEIEKEQEENNLPHSLNKKIEFSIEQEHTYGIMENATYHLPVLFISEDEDYKIDCYLKLIVDAYERKEHSVIITPSIYKAEELYIRLKRFLKGYNIVLYHSLNSKSSNYDVYEQIKNDNYDCLITVLGGSLLPFRHVRTIIMEDCDDPNYTLETFPYLSLKDCLIEKSKIIKSRLILSSMCPSCETYYVADTKRLGLAKLDYKKESNVSVVSMKDELIEENNTIISSVLKGKIENSIRNNKITLLICNNLSFSTQVRCRDCGKVLKCPTCGVPLSYSKKKDEVRCNYCGYKQDSFNSCKCGSSNFISFGFGLEQVEEKVKELFPTAKVMELSSNSISSVNDLETLIGNITDSACDIIIGTNNLVNITKSSNIDTVGLLYADSFLNANSYLASEQTFNIIKKAMRFDNVVIQTYYPTHSIINTCINGSYKDFYNMEIEQRRLLDYPPFKEFSLITVKGDYSEMFHFANYFKKAVSYSNDLVVLGPVYDYKMQCVKVIIKYTDYSKLLKSYTDTINHFDTKKITVSLRRYTRGG